LAQDEYFYSGEEAGRSNKEYSEFTREEEVETEGLRREETETSGIVPLVEESIIITPPVVLVALNNQRN
jgi:hypothetical protein